MTFQWETCQSPKCQAEFPLPLLGNSNELLQVHLLLPQGSKQGLTLHEAFATNVQLDLPQCRLQGPTHMVFKLALVLHKVRLHDHYSEWDMQRNLMTKRPPLCLRSPSFPILQKPVGNMRSARRMESRWPRCVYGQKNLGAKSVACTGGQGLYWALFCFFIF